MIFHPNIIDFFKKHNMYDEKMFQYLQNNTTMLDYNYEDERIFIGCFQLVNKKNIITGVHLNIPYVQDEKTALINIHELTHGIEFYKKIGKPYKPDITVETLPLLYERLYIMENPSIELENYGKYLDNLILKESKEEYLFGLNIRDILIEEYNYNMDSMTKKIKKLAKNYHK